MTIDDTLDEANDLLKALRLKVLTIAQRTGTFDHEAQEMDADIEAVRLTLANLRSLLQFAKEQIG